MNSKDETLKYLKYFISCEKLKSPDHIISLYAHIYGLIYAVEFLLKETNLESKIIQEPLQKYIKDKLIEEFPELKEIYDNHSKNKDMKSKEQ